MKTNLFVRLGAVKAAMSALFLFLMSSMSSAQITKYYANAQVSQTYGVCIGCGVVNPLNAIGPNENDYSVLQVSIGLLARTEQTLIFPNSAYTNKLVIGIGSNGTPLNAQVLGGVSIETFNGNVSNNDYQNLNNDILKLGDTDPSKGEIELTMNKPYDRIKINVNAGLLSLGGELRVYYGYQYKDPFISMKVASQNGQVTLDKSLPAEGSEVTLVNTSGKEVFRTKLQSNTFETNQPSGVYIMTLQTKKGEIYSQKIMIK